MKPLALLALCAGALAFAPASTLADPAPAPTPAVSFEGGASTDQLTNDRGAWNEQDLQGLLNGPISACLDASNNQRFGYDDHWYEGGVYLPTSSPHGNLELLGGYSPEHHILPAAELGAAYDLRAGGGFGYQAAFTGKTYPGINVGVGTVGFDRYFGDERVAVALTTARLSDVPGLAVSYGVKWSAYKPKDTVTFSASTGRDVENTGTAIAVYHETDVGVDELHWMSPLFALHAGLESDNIAGAYARFEVRLALRERF